MLHRFLALDKNTKNHEATFESDALVARLESASVRSANSGAKVNVLMELDERM